MPRQVVTQSDVEQMLASGVQEAVLLPDAIITAAAAELAQSRGVRLQRQDVQAAPATSIPAGGPAPAGSPDDRERVRRAVVSALGRAPEQLDAVLDRVMGR